MKIKDGFKLRTLGTEYIVTAEGEKQINFNKIISLNSSAAFLWKNVEGRDFTAADLAELLVGEYDVDGDRALEDSKSIAAKWIEAGIVEK